MQRTKGASGEREISAIVRDLTGFEVKRRVRNHAGDSDLTGIPGWSVEVKRHKTASRGEIKAWWQQAVSQCGSELPVLFFRRDRDDWRAVWPVAVILGMQHAGMWADYQWTVEGSIEAWSAVMREVK
jgi:hypothetical protein